ncbi:MAG: 3-oxoacyl-[acyl-carrier-protein] reductase [bacterium]
MNELKQAIITGGARGIGKQIALALASRKNNIILWDLLEEECQQTAREIEQQGVKCSYYLVDITDQKAVQEVINEITKDDHKIDILVNNAGITKDNLIMKMTDQEFRKVIEVNLTGSFICTKAVIRNMIKNRWGRIVNISSVVGLFGNPGQANYSSSKAGLIGLTKSTAKEVASRGVTVNAICPGFIQSEMTDKLSDKVKQAYMDNIPARKFGEAKDVANLVSFLVSDEASYITGEVIRVDGGLAM